MIDSAMEDEVEELSVDMEVVGNGWDDAKAKVSAGITSDIVKEEVEVVERRKGRESRESRRKRKEREAAGDVAEDAEAKEERKRRRDEKDKHRSKDQDDMERRDHRPSRDRKDAKRKKEKENKERKERRDERHGSVRDSRVKEDSKDLDPRVTSDKRERREERLERKDSADVDSHAREVRDPVCGSTLDRTYSGKEDPIAATQLRSALVNDEQEEGEILDEDSGPAKEWESGEICTREEAVNQDGFHYEDVSAEKNLWSSPPLEKLSSHDEIKVRPAGLSYVLSLSKYEGSRPRSSQGVDVGHDNYTDIAVPNQQLKSKHSHHSRSPVVEDGLVSGKRDNGGRRRRSPTPENMKGSSRDRHHRRGRSRSRDSDNQRHKEQGRSRSLESGKEREVQRKRTLSPEVARNHIRRGSPSREVVRERRTGVDLQDGKKRSWSPDDSYEQRHSRDNPEQLDRVRRSRSRESGWLKASSRAESVDRRRRSRSRESLREKRVSTEWESSRHPETMEKRRRSRSRESAHRRGDDREVSRHGEAHEKRRGSRPKDVPRSYKVEDRESSRHEWRGDDGPYKSSWEDRNLRDSRHFEIYRENVYPRDKDRNGTSSHDRTRGHKALHSKDNQQSVKDSLVESITEEENQEEYQERVALQLAAQEDDDPEKIKEESRRRRQAILEQFKRQQQQKAAEHQSANVSSNSAVQDHPSDPTNGGVVAATSTLVEPMSSGKELSLGKGALQNGAQPKQTNADGGLGAGSPKSERSADMFCDDIFGESPAGGRRLGKGDGLALDTSGLTDNWDDAEGYYCFRIGEMLDGRYEVASSHGRGVFSTVVRARDLRAGRGEPEEVAIKIIRNNETMFKAGQQELVILKKLAGADPENKRHCVRLLSSFEYRSHLCLVFESLHMNLREILKKFGRNIGINLNAVRAYAKQLFIALKHLKNCGVLHCDIKPDNMLVNEAKNVLKLCDFGSAMFAGENEITPYLVSRFYRAPEIILGLPYDHALDIWSVGCCLYELYTGKMLFPGHTNNDMLRLHMELKGPFPKKMLKKAAFADQHFDQDFNFCAIEEDPVTKKTIKRILVNVRPKDMGILVNSAGSVDEDPKLLASFKDLLEKIFILDPDKRLTVSQALNHPFISGK